jgi:hypothetical protein
MRCTALQQSSIASRLRDIAFMTPLVYRIRQSCVTQLSRDNEMFSRLSDGVVPLNGGARIWKFI